MHFCPQCGTKLPQRAVFCPNCGLSLNPKTPPEMPAQRQAAASHGPFPSGGDQTPPPPKYDFGYPPSAAALKVKKPGAGSKTPAIVISVSAVLLLLIFFLIWSLLAYPFEGYWVNTGIDYGNGLIVRETGFSDEVGLQINRDKTVEFYSEGSFLYRAQWKKTAQGLEISPEFGNSFILYYQKQQLVLHTDKMSLYFTKGEKPGEAEAASAKAPSFVAGSGEVGDGKYYITVNGAEHFVDYDGDEAIRIYFEFTNGNRDIPSVSAMSALDVEASQDGKTLDIAYSMYSEAGDPTLLFIRPGVTMQASAEFKYEPSGGSLELHIFSSEDGKSGGLVSASYLPDSLPGPPPAYVTVPVSEPEWTADLNHQGMLEDYYISIYDAEPVTDAYGEAAIRIHYAFTNHSAEEISMDTALLSMAYQDGIALIYTHTEDETDSDAAYYAFLAPGDSIVASRVFLLRNAQSPVEAELESFYEDKVLGRVFSLP